MTTTVLVIGGNGFFGKTVRAAIGRLADMDVRVAGRNADLDKGEVRLDLNNPGTFEALNAFDVIVNCSDTLIASPDAAIAHVLARGGTFVETTDDAETITRLVKARLGPNAPVTSGHLLIGLGIMPGLSNITAAELYRARGGAKRLEVAIRLDPLSGAGAGMSALSARVIGRSAQRFEDGKLIKDPAVWPGIQVPFTGGPAGSIRTGLPEAVMLGYSTSAPSTATFLSLGNPAIELAMLGMAAGMPRDPFFKPLAQGVVTQAFTGVRTVLFRDGVTPLEIVAMADRASLFRHDGDSISVRISDGIQGAADAVAAGLALMAAKPLIPGAYLPDQAFGFAETIAKMRELAGGRYTIAIKRTMNE